MDAQKIIFPELSYEIVGSAFSVFNDIGYGLPEKAYHDALAKEFTIRNLPFERESYLPLQYRNEYLTKYFADFLVGGKIVVEIKVMKKLGYVQVKQLFGYLHSSSKKLGILIYFTSDGVKYRRVLNPKVDG